MKQLHSYGFESLDNSALNVTLVKAGERILPALSPRISAAAHLELSKLDVRVLTHTMVTSVNASGLNTQSGEFIDAVLMVWAAGIKVPNFMKDISGLESNRLNQLLVEPTSQTKRDPHILPSVAVPPARKREAALCHRALSRHIRWLPAALPTFWR